jgi:predicted Zn-dependent peptidase
MGLCYDVSSVPDLRKGLLFVSAGISAENFDTARELILAQLDAIRNGDVTGEELDAAKAICVADTLAISDSQNALDSFYLVRAVEGTDFSPEESAELLKEVTASDVIDAAKATECDIIFLLAPSDDTAEDDDPDSAGPAEDPDSEV